MSQANSTSTTIIGVAGGSASGKSTLVRKLQEAFVEEHVTTLCHDFYYKAHDELSLEERAKLNYDHPHSFDTDMPRLFLHRPQSSPTDRARSSCQGDHPRWYLDPREQGTS